MKSYDDLQRFKEKTQTNHIEFRDMSDQTRSSDGANWPIIRQLMDDGTESTFGHAQSLHIAPPQPVSKDTFSPRSVPGDQDPQVQRPVAIPNVTAFVAAKPTLQPEESLLASISAQLKPVPSASRVSAPVDASPGAVVESSVPPTSGEQPRFKQLYQSAQEPQGSPLPKDTQLHDLLERIASCR